MADEEIKPIVPTPTVPPPPKYDDFFPGFEQELQQFGMEHYRAQERLRAAEQYLAKVSSPVRFEFAVPGFFQFLLPKVRKEEEVRAAQQDVDMALQDVKSYAWRQEVMVTLPNYLSIPGYKIQSPEDILNYIPIDSPTAADSLWLSQTYEKLKYLSNTLPEDYSGDILDVQSRILNEVLTAPKLELRAVHNLTVEELAKSFTLGVAELPEGLSEGDVRSLLGKMELAEKEMLTAQGWLIQRAAAWREETARLNLIRQGLVVAEAPELTPWEFVKLLTIQPMMATVELLEKYSNILPRPIAASAIIGVHRLFDTPEHTYAARLEEHYNFFKSMGYSSWESYAKAFNDWEAPWYAKAEAEMVFDPVSYIGLGIGTAAANKVGYGLTRIGIRGVGTRIGPWVGAVESGYVRGADAVFKGGIQVVLSPVKGAFWLTGAGYQIPRTATMMSRNFARKSIMEFKAVLDRRYPDVMNLKGLTVRDLADTAESCIRQAIERPMEGHDLMVRAGANLLEFNYIDDIVAKRLIGDVAGDVVLDTGRLAHLNNEILNMFSGQGERVTAGKLIADLGQEATEESVEKLSARLVAFREKVVDSAIAGVKGDTSKDVMLNIFNRLEGIRYSNLHSPMTSYMAQAGRTVSWVSRVADRVLYSSQLVALERKLVMPVARWNLLFANFGPYNFLENMQRSFLGGGELLHPKSYSGVAETNSLLRGSANAPYELYMFERGEARLAQAMVDPKTGRTAVFKGGKIPFVTRNVTIPERVPLLGGKTLGAKINIAGRDHSLASFQDMYDMWAHFNSMQVAYDYQVHYMKALAELAPDELGRITGVMSKYRSQLDSIGAIAKSDARDIERVLMQEATVGPEVIRAHASIDVLEFERRQISKELGKTFDRCTNVRGITKKGIRDEVLDGSIFRDVDGRIAAYIESERELSLISLKNQMDVITKEAEAFAANPPKNMTEFLGDMNNVTAMIEGTSERMHDYRRLTELRKAKLSPADMDDFEVGSAKLLAEYMETSEEQLVRIMNQLTTHAKAAGLDEVQLARLADLDSISRLELENILATRNKIAEIEAVIPRTPKRARNERFWQQQRAKKAVIWDEYDKNARRFKDLRLRASRNFLNSVDQPAFTPDYIPEVTDKLTPNHLAYLYGVTGDDLYRGLTRVQHHTTIRPREDFILHTREAADAYAAKFGKVASDIGFTDDGIGEVYDQLWRNLGVEPSILTPDSPTVMQLEEIRQELTRLHAANKIPESDIVKYRQYINSVADEVGDMPMYRGETVGATPEWWATKEQAVTRAREMHALAFPTYDDANIIDEAMRAIFPFWNYELFRWRWIPRTWMRTPGTMTGLARYMNYTDQGYLPVPGTDLQINILRGSVWMGGLRSLYLKDFPEYYDKFPGMSFIDYIGRMGFFPGIHVMLPVALFGGGVGKAQLAEVAPAWIRGGLSALRQLSPEHIGKALDIVYPDRFRDYMTMLTLGEEGYDADLIWRKRQEGQKLTEEEEKLWLRAEARVDGVKGILMQQTGLFRIRPKEYTELRQHMRNAIEEATGVPVSVQEQIDRMYPVTGKRFSDYYSLDVLQQKLLYEFETYRRWQGVMTPLYPAGWQELDIKTRDYYEEIDRVYNDARYVGVFEDGVLVRPSIVEINRQLVAGEIGPDQWKSMRSDIQGSLTEAVRILGESPAYKDVPKTFEERAKMLEERGIPTPTQSPDQELLYYYYELTPEYAWNWEAQRMERDFDTYYAKIDILLESLDEAHRQRLLDRIQADWTPLEILYWKTSREYMRPYRNLRSVVLAEYNDEQVQQIRRYEVARGDEREALQEIIGPDGDKLISGFNRRLREARQRFRILDPNLDAWLNFWGQTDKLMTTRASEIYDMLREQYLVERMIK